MDKLWAGPSQFGGAPWDGIMEDFRENWDVQSEKNTMNKREFSGREGILPQSPTEFDHDTLINQNKLLPEARTGLDVTWEGNSNAWSAALGAMGGAGTVLVIAALLFLFKRPKKQEMPVLAPMDIGQNSTSVVKCELVDFTCPSRTS
ncbi:unnamed protein product, partial [Brenthis ino]